MKFISLDGKIEDDWFYSENVVEVVMNSAKGSYQYDLLLGKENWSGSSLCGKASHWSSKYAKSRENLIKRIQLSLPKWKVYTDLVLRGKPKRWHRELILERHSTMKWVWL